MSKLRDAAQQALEALIAATPVKAKDPQMQADAIVALRAALAEQPAKREPVAWKHDCAALLTNGVELWIDACPHCGKPRPAPQPKPAEQEAVAWCDQYEGHIDGLRHYSDGGAREIPLYTAPQPAKREPLTDAEIGQVRWQCRWNRMSTDDNVVYATTQQLDAFARAIIAAYERKNGVQT